MISNFGFIILSPDHNIGGLKNTIRSLENNYKGSDYICIVPKEIKTEQYKEIKENCKAYKGGLTITSLINKGFEKTKSEWNILIIEGSRVTKSIYKKYNLFIEKEEDILYPLIFENDNYGYKKIIYDKFYDCTINGICINKSFFNKVGKFSENPLEISRKFWALEAKEKKANFKTILGIKIC